MKHRSALLAMPAILALGACAAEEPSYDGLEPAEFAAVACSGWASWIEAEVDGGDMLDELTGSGEEQKEYVIQAANGQIAALQQARDDISEAQPAVADGAAIIGSFTDYYDKRIEVGEARLEQFRDFPTDLGPNEDKIEIEAIDVFYHLGEQGPDQPNDFPFGSIEDQEVIQAIADEPSCDDFVTVF